MAASPPLQESRRAEIMTRLFKDLQIARFNELYYQKRSASLRNWTKGANIVSSLAASLVLGSLLTGPGSPLLGFGPIAWQILTLLAALSAAASPALGLSEKASQMERAALGHSIIKERIRRLLSDLKVSELKDSHVGRDEEINAMRLALSPLDELPSMKLREKCWERTLEEIPSEKAWSII